MPMNHTKNLYLIGATALALGGYGAFSTPAPVHDSAVHKIERPSQYDWASLGQEKTENLGAALKGVKPGKVTIFCGAPTCHDLALDIDDAFQLAEWHRDIQSLPVESEVERGIFIGPPGQDAENLAAALLKATGLEASIVPIGNLDGVGIIIGKVSR